MAAPSEKKLTEAECLEWMEAIALELLPPNKHKWRIKDSAIGNKEGFKAQS